MDVVGAEEHGFAGGEGDVVKEEEDEEADVMRELSVEALDEWSQFADGGGGVGGEGYEGFGVGGDGVLG